MFGSFRLSEAANSNSFCTHSFCHSSKSSLFLSDVFKQKMKKIVINTENKTYLCFKNINKWDFIYCILFGNWNWIFFFINSRSRCVSIIWKWTLRKAWGKWELIPVCGIKFSSRRVESHLYTHFFFGENVSIRKSRTSRDRVVFVPTKVFWMEK